MSLIQSKANKLARDAEKLADYAQVFEYIMALNGSRFNEEFQKVIIEIVTDSVVSWCFFIGDGGKSAWIDMALERGNWADAFTQIRGAVDKYNLPLRFTERILEARKERLNKEA